MLIVQPSFGFTHPDCKLQLPLGDHAKNVLHCEIQLLTCYPKVQCPFAQAVRDLFYGMDTHSQIMSLARVRSMFLS